MKLVIVSLFLGSLFFTSCKALGGGGGHGPCPAYGQESDDSNDVEDKLKAEEGEQV